MADSSKPTPTGIPVSSSSATVAPTPQNTPLNPSGSALSRPHVPDTIGEAEEPEEINPVPVASGTRQPPAALGGSGRNLPPEATALLNAAVQSRLADLIGRSSGYLATLPSAVRDRVSGLEAIQVAQQEIEARFQKEVLELEKKYQKEYAPIYERRARIVAGSEEPTEDEVKKGIEIEAEDESDEEDEDEEEEDEDEDGEGGVGKVKELRTPATADEREKSPKGIPEFWLTVLKGHLEIGELITERDEPALKHLTDLRVEYLDGEKQGFTLVFEFGEGAKEYFGNGKLEKTYVYSDQLAREGHFIYEHAKGTEIEWKEGKNLTVKIETKKQRNKNTNKTRVVKHTIPTASFFGFFAPPQPPADEDDDDDESIDEKLQLDYQIGEDIKERVIPRAVDYFTGKATRYDMPDEFDGEDGFEDEYSDDDEEDELAARVAQLGVTGQGGDPQECKQQ